MDKTEKDSLLEKIKAAVRLARRAATEGEKTAAERAAKRLADKAGIALDELEVTESSVRTDVFDDGDWHTKPGMELGYISAVLRQHFGIILIQGLDPVHRKVRFSWIGTKINVEIAKHVYKVLLREVQKDWREARMMRETARKTPLSLNVDNAYALMKLRNLNRRAFLDGWFAMIHKKLREHPLRNDLEQFEAEKKSAEEMFKRMQEEHNIAENKAKSTGNLDRKSMELGIIAANKLNLNRPCEGNGYRGLTPQIKG